MKEVILYGAGTKGKEAYNFLKVCDKNNDIYCFCDKNTAEILDLFIEDEQYYFEVENPHFEWIIPFFESEKFLKELVLVINENKKLLYQK